MKGRKAFTVKAHWGLLISAGLKTCENRSFRVSPGFYLVHASGSLSFSEWHAGSVWIAERFGTAIICPSFDLCRTWCGQIVCSVRIVSALTASTDPWYLGDVAWELERPVPCGRGVYANAWMGICLACCGDLYRSSLEDTPFEGLDLIGEHAALERFARHAAVDDGDTGAAVAVLAEELDIGGGQGGEVRRFHATVSAVDLDREVEALSEVDARAGRRDVQSDVGGWCHIYILLAGQSISDTGRRSRCEHLQLPY